MPAIFFGHGNPMNAVLRNSYTERWTKIGTHLPRPRAILCLSAHWYIQDAAVTFPVEGVDGGSISMLAVQVG
jgi:4,5-DOPA dioxygenase extradiol